MTMRGAIFPDNSDEYFLVCMPIDANDISNFSVQQLQHDCFN